MRSKKLSSHFVILFSLGILSLIVLSACGGGGTQPSVSPGASSSPAGSGSNPDPIPGKEEFGTTKQELYNLIENVEAEISKCMSEAGFEYIAVDYNAIRSGMVADKSLPGMFESTFIKEYGYGISTLYTGLAPQLSELSTPAQIGLGKRNVEIFRNLSPEDQVAYSHSLFGEHPDATFAVGLETENFTRTGGCTRRAIEKYFTPEQLSVTYVNPFDVLVDQDPRMVAANARYSECLGDAGFDYASERDIEPDLRKKLDDITGGQPLGALSADQLTALTELQGYERVLAAVAVQCESEYLDPVADQVERELYAGFNQ